MSLIARNQFPVIFKSGVPWYDCPIERKRAFDEPKKNRCKPTGQAAERKEEQHEKAFQSRYVYVHDANVVLPGEPIGTVYDSVVMRITTVTM